MCRIAIGQVRGHEQQNSSVRNRDPTSEEQDLKSSDTGLWLESVEAADRLKRREPSRLAHAALATAPTVHCLPALLGPNGGFGATQRVERLADGVQPF
jgi:hypothetical protein